MRTFTTSARTSPHWRRMRSPATEVLAVAPQYFTARFDFSPKTARSYRDQFGVFDAWCRSRPGRKTKTATLADLNPALVEEFVAYRMKHGVRPGRRGSEHQGAKAAIALKSLATFLAERNLWRDEFGRSVLASVRIPLTDAQRKRLSTAEFARVIAAVEESPFAERDRAILFLLAGNGPREKEVVSLQLQHYDRLAGTITIPPRGTKGRTGYRKARQMELDELVRAELDRYLDESRVGPDHPESPLITTRNGHAFTGNGLYQVLKRLKASSGVPHLCPHALRHYWTEHFDGDLLELMRAGGWNSLTMVDRYRGHRPPQRDRVSTLASALAATPRSRSKRRSQNQGDGLHIVRREAAQLVS